MLGLTIKRRVYCCFASALVAHYKQAVCVDRMSESATAANSSDSIVCPWPDCGKQYRSRKTLKDHQRIKGHGDVPMRKKKKKQKLCPVADCDQL